MKSRGPTLTSDPNTVTQPNPNLYTPHIRNITATSYRPRAVNPCKNYQTSTLFRYYSPASFLCQAGIYGKGMYERYVIICPGTDI